MELWKWSTKSHVACTPPLIIVHITAGPTSCPRSQWKLWISRRNWRVWNHHVCSRLHILGYPCSSTQTCQSSSRTTDLNPHWYSISHRWMNSKCHCHSIQYVIFYLQKSHKKAWGCILLPLTLCFSEFSVLCLNKTLNKVWLFLLYLNNAPKKNLFQFLYSHFLPMDILTNCSRKAGSCSL